MDVSVGVMAHNEQDNIKNILEVLTHQKLSKVNIKEIIVVSSSTDNTNTIAEKYDITLIKQRPRTGKAYAINAFLKKSGYHHLVLCSADVIPKKDAIEKICIPLQNESIGIAACRPKPTYDNSILGKIIHLQWYIHHRISLIRPKFGEMIAFRKEFKRIDNTAADEEYIAMKIMQQGYNGAYASKSIVHNTGPRSFRDFIKQKRRIYWGHLELKKKYDYEATSMIKPIVMKEYLKCVSMKNLPIMLLGGILEASSRCLGLLDYHLNRNHYVWEMVKTNEFKNENLNRNSDIQ